MFFLPLSLFHAIDVNHDYFECDLGVMRSTCIWQIPGQILAFPEVGLGPVCMYLNPWH